LTKLIATWIRKYVTGSFHDQFEVPCGLEQVKFYKVLTQCEVNFHWNNCETMLS
jgi:hypothetical protein